MRWQLLPLLVLLACCSANTNRPLSEQDELVVFLLEEGIGPSPDPDWMTCISVDGKDPQRMILDAIKSDGITTFDVASSCEFVADESGSYHVGTKKKAMFVDVRILKILGYGKYLVNTSMYHHGLFGGSKELEIKKQGGKWVLTKMHRMSVS